QITWNPSALYQELLAGQSATQTLTIGNLGFKPLSYTLSQPINRVTLLSESFANTLPTGWTQQYQKGNVDWNFVTTGTHGVPRGPYEGTHFASFYSAISGVTTWLITPQLDLSQAVPGSATLSFWHFQQATTQGSFPYQDFLEVYCKYSNGTWVKLAEYLSEVRVWTQRVITLPNLSESYQIAFVANTARTAQTGHGVCVDAVQVVADVVEGIDWYSINGASSFDGIVDGSLRDHDTISIEFSPGALDPGCYTSLMRLSSNSQTNSNVEIPVTLDVGGTPLPVHLSSFTALIDGRNQVRLDWVTLAESGVMGFYILRCDTDDLASALQVSPLIEATNTSQTQAYSYTDSETLPGTAYFYWLQCLDMDGGLVYHGPILVTTGADNTSTPDVPLVSLLEPAYPNPFNIETSIGYCLDRPGTARIDILNARGQLVRSIALEHAEAGRFSLLFDGRDERGIELASGIYYYRLSSGSFCQIRRMILLK
ncbi:MAG TPA: choice-of-anchor J domain-containing protein, partial [Candidatus Syntrophosphaera sp.]|nr:choice-of-anchor J domain-containing protein [Candidatus Syntrophosphaera sp.]